MIKYKRIIATIIIMSILVSVFPFYTVNAQTATDTSGVGVGRIARIIAIIQQVVAVIKAIKDAGRGLPGNVPHLFPFGGKITSSDGGCSLRWWIWQIVVVFGVPIPIPCINCGWFPLNSTAITVGPPVASPGEMFTFAFISDVYRNHAEDSVGPWALGLAFTPFPVDQINDQMERIRIPIPNGWMDHFHLSCPRGDDDYYKVITKLGTSPRK